MRRFLGILIIMASCGQSPGGKPASGLELIKSPPTRFPLLDYDAVDLFSVDSMHYQIKSMVALEKDILNSPYTDGMAFLDSLGHPTSRYFTRHRLSPSEMEEVKSVFTIPRNNGEISKVSCIPIYRDAFVFYQDGEQVAQAQICLDCQQAYFTVDTTMLAERFSSDGNWDNVESFLSKVKAR